MDRFLLAIIKFKLRASSNCEPAQRTENQHFHT
jgi:hypothetical protein